MDFTILQRAFSIKTDTDGQEGVDFFLKIVAHQPNLESISKACLVTSSCTLLSSVLFITDDERAKLYSVNDFENVLLTKVDSRLLLDNSLIQNVLLKSITEPASFYPGLGNSATSVAASTMGVLTTCIDFDLLTLCQRTYKLYFWDGCKRISSSIIITGKYCR